MWQAYGENLTRGQQSVEMAMNSWMNSQGHKENILKPGYTHIGVEYCFGIWVLQLVETPVM